MSHANHRALMTKRVALFATMLATLVAIALPTAAISQAPPPSASPPTPDNLVLWNRFEEEQDVLDSEIGPDIQLASYIYQNWDEAEIVPAQFGNGLFVNHDTNEGWSNNGANFFAADLSPTALTPQQGTIEFWFQYKYASSTHNHAYFFDTRNTFANHYPDQNWFTDVSIAAGWNGWNYGSYGKRFFFSIGHALSGAWVTAYTPDFSASPGGAYEFSDGTMMHLAFVWDVAGIDGSADTLRIYVNGELAGAAGGTWPAAGTIDPFLFIGSGPNAWSWDHHYNAVKGVTDNLLIWNVAKTDFSGRFEEDPFPNHAPDCSLAAPSAAILWPPNNKFTSVAIIGISEPDGDPITLAVDRIYQDEPVGRGNSAPDGRGIGASAVELRAERLGNGNGRFYHVGFTASDGQGGTCTGEIAVAVPHDRAKPAIDDGALFDSTLPTP